jgi:DNA-binding IclR family transcriptional regulator
MDKKDATDQYVAAALDRGLQMLEILSEARAALPLAEIARRMGLSRGVAFRLAHTLERRGYLERIDAVPNYRPGVRVMGLGFSYLRSLGLTELARPYMERLRDATDASVHLGVLDGRDVFYVARIAARHGVVSYIDIGDRSPAHASAIGHALLASLPDDEITRLYRDASFEAVRGAAPRNAVELLQKLAEVRSQGYAVSIGALHSNVLAIAAAFRNADGKLAGAVSVTSLDTERLRDAPLLGAAVIGAATEISRALGYTGA